MRGKISRFVFSVYKNAFTFVALSVFFFFEIQVLRLKTVSIFSG